MKVKDTKAAPDGMNSPFTRLGQVMRKKQIRSQLHPIPVSSFNRILLKSREIRDAILPLYYAFLKFSHADETGASSAGHFLPPGVEDEILYRQLPYSAVLPCLHAAGLTHVTSDIVESVYSLETQKGKRAWNILSPLTSPYTGKTEDAIEATAQAADMNSLRKQVAKKRLRSRPGANEDENVHSPLFKVEVHEIDDYREELEDTTKLPQRMQLLSSSKTVAEKEIASHEPGEPSATVDMTKSPTTTIPGSRLGGQAIDGGDLRPGSSSIDIDRRQQSQEEGKSREIPVSIRVHPSPMKSGSIYGVPEAPKTLSFPLFLALTFLGSLEGRLFPSGSTYSEGTMQHDLASLSSQLQTNLDASSGMETESAVGQKHGRHNIGSIRHKSPIDLKTERNTQINASQFSQKGRNLSDATQRSPVRPVRDQRSRIGTTEYPDTINILVGVDQVLSFPAQGSNTSPVVADIPTPGSLHPTSSEMLPESHSSSLRLDHSQSAGRLGSLSNSGIGTGSTQLSGSGTRDEEPRVVNDAAQEAPGSLVATDEVGSDAEEPFLPDYFREIFYRGATQEARGKMIRSSQKAKKNTHDSAGIGTEEDTEVSEGESPDAFPQRMVPVGLDHGKVLFQPEASVLEQDRTNEKSGQEMPPLQKAFRFILDAFVQKSTFSTQLFPCALRDAALAPTTGFPFPDGSTSYSGTIGPLSYSKEALPDGGMPENRSKDLHPSTSSPLAPSQDPHLYQGLANGLQSADDTAKISEIGQSVPHKKPFLITSQALLSPFVSKSSEARHSGQNAAAGDTEEGTDTTLRKPSVQVIASPVGGKAFPGAVGNLAKDLKKFGLQSPSDTPTTGHTQSPTPFLATVKNRQEELGVYRNYSASLVQFLLAFCLWIGVFQEE